MKKTALMCGLVAIGFIAGYAMNPNKNASTPETADPTEALQAERVKTAQNSPQENLKHKTGSTIQDAQPSDSMQPLQELAPHAYELVLLDLEDYIKEAMLRKMMSTDPLKALDFIHRNPNDPLFGTLLREWTETDPVSSYNWIKENQSLMESDSYQEVQLSALISMTEQRPWEALKHVDDLVDAADQEMVYLSITSSLADENPEKAFNWLESLASDLSVSKDCLTTCYHQAMAAYSKTNPNKAALIIQDIESPVLQKNLTGAVAVSLAAQDLNQAVTWLQSLEHTESKLAGWERMMEEADQENQQQLVDLFLSDAQLMEPTSGYWSQIMFHCAEADPARTAEIYDQLPESGKPHVAEILVHEWLLDRSVDKAAQWVSKQPTGEAYDRGARLLSQEYMNSQSDPAKALVWAGQIGDAHERTTLLKDCVSKIETGDLTHIRDNLDSMYLSATDQQTIDEMLTSRIENEYSALVLP